MSKWTKKFINLLLLCTLILTLMPMSRIYSAVATAPAPVGPIPNEKQMEWYHGEKIGFIHFGINTFYDVEWGDGKEDPSKFNPSNLDVNQWVKTFKDAGFTKIIIIAKHHDGFCYWPSKYTTFSVKSSPWKGGNGDLVGDVVKACHEQGLKVGMYLSPWDRHESSYGTPAYNDYFNNQLTELLSNYGTINEVWWDGAGEAAGNYAWERWVNTIHTLQPNALIWGSKGSAQYVDLRWIGNEQGFAGDPCWSTISRNSILIEDGNYLNHGQVNGEAFIPAETNTSIRPGWFYHASEDTRVKSVQDLVNYYFNSVGRNTVMLLNIPPDPTGQMKSTDVTNILGMSEKIKKIFATNLAANSTVTASDTRGAEYSAKNIIDNDENTYYASSDGVTNPTITLDLGTEKTFDTVMLQEVIQLGQRVTGWSLEVYDNNQWNTLVNKKSIGYKWIERFQAVTASKVRLRITGAKACPTLHTLGLYYRGSEDNYKATKPVQTETKRSAYTKIEAEAFNDSNGSVKAETCGEGGENLGWIQNGDWVKYSNVDFGSGADSFTARVASGVNTGKIYVRLDTPTGTQIGTLNTPNTGDGNKYTEVTIPITKAIGVHDVYFYFDAWSNINWFLFTKRTSATFYEKSNFGGTAIAMAQGYYNTQQLTAAGVPGNWASSIKVPAGYTVEAYDGDNFTGKKWIFTADNSDLKTEGCNKKISSVKIYKSKKNKIKKPKQIN